MPVTIKPASHGASPVPSDVPTTSATDLLSRSCYNEYNKHFKKMIKSSFDDIIGPSNNTETKHPQAQVMASDNGFLNAAIDAYSNHHHLVLRPEDIWFAILTQLNFYVNKNAEGLRHHFVWHEGKEKLTIFGSGSVDTYDWGNFAKVMTQKLEQKIVDPELREWILPRFSTTTETDIEVASILMMGMLQKYFTYECCIKCGIPSVKLLGLKQDWETILQKLDYLPELGDQAALFGKLLKPIVKRFVNSFDHPDSAETKSFWQKIAHYTDGGSGPSFWSGWITAFCFWDANGVLLFDPKLYNQPTKPTITKGPTFFLKDSVLKEQLKESEPAYTWEFASFEAFDSDDDDDYGDVTIEKVEKQYGVLRLDGVEYHTIKSDAVPRGYASVPVEVDDNGHKFVAHMIAGSIGIQVFCSGEPAKKNGSPIKDTLQPVSGWWMFEIKEEIIVV